MTIDTSGYREAARDPASGAIIYERPTALPRAFIVHRLDVAPHADALARMVGAAFDPRKTALVESPPNCALADAQGQDSATLASDEFDRVTFDAHATSDGFLVMSDTFYPGWRAEVDGKPADVVRADFALRGVCLPAGDHRVVFIFDPATLKVSAILSIMGLAIVIVSNARRRE
jgi:hypothetical protein